MSSCGKTLLIWDNNVCLNAQTKKSANHVKWNQGATKGKNKRVKQQLSKHQQQPSSMSQGDILVNRRMQSRPSLAAVTATTAAAAVATPRQSRRFRNSKRIDSKWMKAHHPCAPPRRQLRVVPSNRHAAMTTTTVKANNNIYNSHNVAVSSSNVMNCSLSLSRNNHHNGPSNKGNSEQVAEELHIVRRSFTEKLGAGAQIQEANEILLHEVLCLLESYSYGEACEILIRNEASLLRAASTARAFHAANIGSNSQSNNPIQVEGNQQTLL